MTILAARTTSKGASLIRGDALRVPLRDGSVHLGITSPPYFALRSYQDDGEHYAGQIGSEPSPVDFLLALWAVADEMHRVLADDGSMWWNLGDKYAGSGGHNNATLSQHGTGASTLTGGRPDVERRMLKRGPRRYIQAADVRAKSLMGLPWRFAMGLICPDLYRSPFEPAACWHDDGPGPCRSCPPRQFPQWIGRAEAIWSKPNGLPESVTDRVRRSHEQWFMVTKQPRYFAGIDEIREPHTGNSHGGGNRITGRTDGVSRDRGYQSEVLDFNPLGKLPGSVWTIPSEPLAVPAHLGVDHFAAFPQEWPRRIILGWSPTGICTVCGEGRRPVVEKGLHAVQATNNASKTSRNADNGWAHEDTPRGASEATITGYACACDVTLAPTRPAIVLDPFSGTGTVAMVARALGRYGVGIDLSRDYLRLANWRVFQSGHARKTEARTNRERQGDLFGGAA